MTDPAQPATTPDPAPASPAQPTPPAPTPPADPQPHTGFSWDEFERRIGGHFTAVGEQISSGIREAFPQPAPTSTPPTSSTGGDNGGDNPTTKDEPKKPEEPAHPAPGEHGGTRLASWWFGSKR